jgi:hypothetical protein
VSKSLPNLHSAYVDSFAYEEFSDLLTRKTIFEGLPRTAEAFIKLQTLILAILNSILKGFGGEAYYVPKSTYFLVTMRIFIHKTHITFQISFELVTNSVLISSCLG